MRCSDDRSVGDNGDTTAIDVVDIEADAASDVTDPEAADGASDAGETHDSEQPMAAPQIGSIEPALGDPLGGVVVNIRGVDLRGASVAIGGETCRVVVPGDSSVACRTPALEPGIWDVVVTTGAGVATAPGAFEAWSPAQLDGARVFDARSGVETDEPGTHYEWQRLTESMGDAWRIRDGNTVTWLPSTGRFWAIGGWNGYEQPIGFSTVPPGITYPPENTTGEVWSTADGVEWRLDLPHDHALFERRHVHNTVLFNDALWVIGGDAHQGYYNHDVLRSDDGITWDAVLAPGDPPWSPRALQVSGVYDGALYTGGGQTLLGPEEEYEYFNDLWRSEDGVSWTLVAPNAPASETRWAGCGMVDGFVEFNGRMWMLGCARYREVAGHEMPAEVWSTVDGVSWQRHADPPWAGKAWPNVLVWDDKIWIMFGYTNGDPANGWGAGNSNEVWYSSDGESWRSLPQDAPAPGSHAQGVAAHADYLLYAGGNHSFGFGDNFDKSAWRLWPYRGASVSAWTDRGSDALFVEAPNDEARPLLIDDAFGEGEPGLHFDGSRNLLAYDGFDTQDAGRTVLWVARTPYLPSPWAWEDTYAPVATVVGGIDSSGYTNSAIGLTDGQLVMINREAELGEFGEPIWSRPAAGEQLQRGTGETRLLGMTHGADGRVTAIIDETETPIETAASYASPRGWSRIGSGLDDNAYYGPNTRFAGTLGAVIILPRVLDSLELARVHRWAVGRFGVP